MIPAVRRTEVLSAANPKLVFACVDPGFEVDGGFLVDVLDTLEFTIHDAGQAGAPQVYPTVADTRAIVDLEADRLSPGRYAAAFVVGNAWNMRDHEIRWYVTRLVGGDEVVFTQRFGVVAINEVVPRAYATVQDMRAEGTPVGFTDARIVSALEAGARWIEQMTRRWFEPRYQVVNLDSRGGFALQLGIPIVALESIGYVGSDFQVDDAIYRGAVRVYNRHVRQGLLSPDDRENPKLELLNASGGFVGRRVDDDFSWFGGGRWSTATQGIRARGIFGYTEPDGSPMGAVPAAIREVNMRLAMRQLRTFWGQGAGSTSLPSGPVISERTMDQSVTYATNSVQTTLIAGRWTGDPLIDQTIAALSAPGGMGGV